MSCYLDSGNKENCFGCEACKSKCPKNAITMIEDNEGFRYPVIDKNKCINCGLCRQACPFNKVENKKYNDNHYAFGGYHKDEKIQYESTSGGAFSAIVDAFCDENYVIFGAKANALEVSHDSIIDKKDIGIFRKSKYSQSKIGDSYSKVKQYLLEGKKVLFSGTPCQIAGLKFYLGNKEYDNLLTVEVVCEGVPSPLYMRKYDKYLNDKYGSYIRDLDYRFTDKCKFLNEDQGKWDFQVMKVNLQNGIEVKQDRWFNPFWNIWLNHLMSRPACYNCEFTTNNRMADITLGDLWGVHLYCKDLYGKNRGASLIISNSEKGKTVLKDAQKYMIGHELDYSTALKYQSPLKKSISINPNREDFMNDLISNNVNYTMLCSKWAKKPNIKLLWQKYIWGNRQKIFYWELKNRRKNGNE